MDAIRATTIPSIRLSRRHGSVPPSPSSTPLSSPTPGSLHLTTHHLIFERKHDVEVAASDATSASKEAEPSTGPQSPSKQDDEVWVPLSILHSVTRTPPSFTGEPSPLILRTRLYETIELAFNSLDDADAVWDSLKGLCGSFSAGGLQNRYAFFCNEAGKTDKKGKGKASWDIYSAEEEFARMGMGTRSKAWRFTDINADFQFCPSYPAKIVVPAKISDTTLSYAVKYRSKSRIPGLVYLHWANLGSITRSSQPMVGITQNARSIQDEKLIEAIFSSHSQHSHKFQPMSVGDPLASSSSLDVPSSGQVVYGATATNVIIDARPTKNAYANSVKGAGTENMLYYKNCKKEYLGIDNIHVMRSSLNGVFDALADAEASGRLDRSALRRTNWLSHLTNILDGVLIVIRTVHLYNSHVLVHCSDGWDRTSQLSALPQLCLDPYFRTARGFAVLIEKDWISYGHRFADRSGHLCNDRVDFVQKSGADGSTQQAFLASVTRQFASSSHAFKETCPVFQQFFDCVYQIQRQFPDRFEWNEQLLRHLVRETYAGATGSFLFNSENDRAEMRARTRTKSVWEMVFDVDELGELKLKPEFRNPEYNLSLDNPDSKAHGADQGVLLFDPQNVRWWFELFGRSDDEMNGRPFANDPGATPLEPTVTEVKVVESPQDDPMTNGVIGQAGSLSLSNSPLSPTVSPSNFAAPSPPPRSSSPLSSRQENLLSQQQLSETVASVQKLGWSAWKSVRKFGEDAARQLQEQQAKRIAAAAEEAERRGSAYASDERTAREASGGGLWSKVSTSNHWASSASDEAPSTSFAPAYTPYRPRHAPNSRASTSASIDPSASTPASAAPFPHRTERQPSSTLSINPWETVSRDEASPADSARPAGPSKAELRKVESEAEARSGDPLGVGFT
ncbi:phosphatidylinositol-3-phosphatase ymr1 [Rhodotorula toruloides]